MSETKKKKNCNNCRFGYWESDGEYGEYNYFVCEKREDNGFNNLDNNLCKESYREKAKVCCELKFLAKCNDCNAEELLTSPPSSDYLCFPCWTQRKDIS